jgi:hypothetical protein
MVKKLKLFMVDESPYMVSLDPIEVGDRAIVTVGGQYPSIVECSTNQVVTLITESKLKSTQAYKIFLNPDNVKLTTEQLDKIIENSNEFEVEINGNEIKYNI